MKRKSSPIGVRFNLIVMDAVRKEFGMLTPQQVLNFLEMQFLHGKYWQVENPVMERNAPTVGVEEGIDNAALESENTHNVPLVNGDKPRNNPNPDFYKGMDLDEENPVFDFGNETLFNINKYSKFPEFTKPTKEEEYTKWAKRKKVFDEKVRAAWAKRK